VRTRLGVVLAALGLTFLTSCIARSGVAVSGSDQQVVLHLARCDDSELVIEIRFATPGRNGIVDDGDDQILWEARSVGPGVKLDEVVVGTVPAGMVETVPLTQGLQRQRPYYGLIDSGVRGYADFRTDELRPDRVLYMGDLRTLAEFEHSARSGGKCATPGSNTDVLVRGVGMLCVVGIAVALAVVIGRRRRTSRGAT
jgi:hypothetical protein